MDKLFCAGNLPNFHAAYEGGKASDRCRSALDLKQTLNSRLDVTTDKLSTKNYPVIK
ncbi:MAG: hypothetical protein OJF48_003160 [Afipia sp.]|nr:MAG: hypothetical protein OJF48_003160 [Afipia sp.]